MGVVVVYESMFGNTQRIAASVAAGVGALLPVELVEVGAAPPLDGLRAELLVAGAPTHAFGLSREQTRKDAEQRAGRALISAGASMREWLDEATAARLRVAAFDTHVKRPNLPGWAGHAIDKRLRQLGCVAVVRPTSFYVHGYEGPLLPAEEQRAQAWGERLGRLLLTAGAR